MSGQRSTSAAQHVCLEIGQPFNPFRLFNGIFIPDALARQKGISSGAKMIYGRLGGTPARTVSVIQPFQP